jgi:GNAT superfamily N-acetyltransferase
VSVHVPFLPIEKIAIMDFHGVGLQIYRVVSFVGAGQRIGRGKMELDKNEQVNKSGDQVSRQTSFLVRMYKPSDDEDIFKLWEHRFDKNSIPKRQEIFHWMVENNPYLSGESPYTVLEYEGKLIGFCGRTPTKFSVDGKILDAFMSNDTMIHPEFRGKGLAGKMVQYQALNSKSFVGALWFSPANHRAYQKASWQDIEGLYPMAKVFNVDLFITKMVNNPIPLFFLKVVGNGMLKLLNLRLSPAKDSKLEITRIESFNGDFDQLFTDVSKYLGLIALRGSEYLNWKYVNRPYTKYSIYAAKEKNKILGYIVFRTARNESRKSGIILDILTNPSRLDVFKNLISQALYDLKNENVDYVSCLMTYPLFRNALRRMGFMKYWKNEPFMVANWQPFFAQDYVTKIRNWYITFGDSDGDFWIVTE